MKSELLIDQQKLAIVRLTNGDHWLRVVLWLGGEFRGGELVGFAREATISVEALDTLSSSYERANWASGLASGALYAFRTLRIPRQRVVVRELSGRLDATNMEAVATAAALAVSTLANKDLPNLRAEGWTCQAHLCEHAAGDRTDEDQMIERAH